MKKLTKILMPVLSCSALTTIVPLGITSCNPSDTKIVGYTIDKDTDMMYGLNKAGEKIKLSDEQFKEMEGGFLVALSDGSYKYVNRYGVDPSGVGEWPTTIKGWMERAAEHHAFYYEIWLLGGTYNLDSIDQAKSSHINFDIKGVVKYNGVFTSNIYIVPTHPKLDDPTEIKENIDVGDFRNLTFTTVGITGAFFASQGSNWSVSGAESMSFQFCHFQGLSVFKTEYLDLYRCSFNSDMITWTKPNYKDGSGRKFSTTQYALWIKEVNFVSFSYCTFLSDGKAVKIETKTNSFDPIFIFNSCQFRIGSKGIPCEIYEQDEKTESDQDKFAVEINNKSLWDTGYHLYIYWYNIFGDILTNKAPDREHTYKHHYGEIGSIDERNKPGVVDAQWDPKATVLKEGELPQ